MKLPYGRYALNYVLHLCTLYKRNRLSRAASLTDLKIVEEAIAIRPLFINTFDYK